MTFPSDPSTKDGLTLEDRAKKLVVDDFMPDAEDYCQPYFDEFAKIYADYILARGSKKLFQRANLKPPYSFTIVESFTPELVEAFFSDKPYVNSYASLPQFYDFEKPVEDYISYSFDDMNIVPKFVEACKPFLLFGTTIVKTPWRKTSKATNLGGTPQITKTFDGADWENIPIWDFFPDPANRSPGNIDIMKGCVHRVWRSIDDLKKNEKKQLSDGSSVGVYVNLDDVKSFVDTKDDSNKGSANTQENYQDKYSGNQSDTRHKDKLEVLEYWGEFDPDGSGNLFQYVITIVERKYVIRCEANPFEGAFKPFLASVNYPVPNEFYGMGEIKPAWSLIREATQLRNSRLDALNLTLNPMMIVDRTAGFNVRNLYTRPGGILLGNDINGIKEFGLSDRALGAMATIGDLDQGIAKAVGLAPSGVEGNVNSNFARTRAGVNYISNNVSSRITLKVRLLAANLLNPFAKRILLLSRQFATNDIFFRLTGQGNNPFQLLPLEALQHDYVICITSAMDRMSKKDRQANLKENIIPLLQLNEQVNPGAFNWNAFLPKTLQDFDYRQATQFINPPEVVQQSQQQKMQMQMMMAEHNAMAQANAQSQLIAQQGQIDSQSKQADHTVALTRDVVKGVMANERADTQEQNQTGAKIGETLLKEIAADARSTSDTSKQSAK